MSLCTMAVAQNAAQTVNGTASQQFGAAATDTELAEVIVTATRRSESIQNVAGQVTALTSGTLTQINARDFNDAGLAELGEGVRVCCVADTLVGLQLGAEVVYHRLVLRHPIRPSSFGERGDGLRFHSGCRGGADRGHG